MSKKSAASQPTASHATASQTTQGARPRWPLVLLVLACLGVGFAAGSILNQQATAKEGEGDPYARLDTFAQVLNQIEQNYVEDVEQTDLVYGAIKGMVRALDPHSTFLTPDELARLRDRTAGQYVGIGIEVGVREGEIRVIAPMPGGPAEKAGIEAGDVIIGVDGKSVKNAALDEAVELLRGERGTKVELTIKRKGEPRPLDFEVERNVVKVVSVEQEMLEPGYGLITVRSFVRNVGHDVRKAYDELVEQNEGEDLKGLVLDLRNNPGGLLREAVDLANIFMENGTIVTTEGRNGLELASHSADARRAYIDVPLVVLVNGGSASASEIVAGALQDHKRAVVVGTQTFGKGSVQNIYDLSDGSGLKLTIARYYTPDHRSIQALGIAPDILAEDVKIPMPETARRFKEADLEGTLDNEQTHSDDETDGEGSGSEDGTEGGSGDDNGKGDGSAGGNGTNTDKNTADEEDADKNEAGGEDTETAPERNSKKLQELPVRTALDQLKAHRILSGKEK